MVIFVLYKNLSRYNTIYLLDIIMNRGSERVLRQANDWPTASRNHSKFPLAEREVETILRIIISEVVRRSRLNERACCLGRALSRSPELIPQRRSHNHYYQGIYSGSEIQIKSRVRDVTWKRITIADSVSSGTWNFMSHRPVTFVIRAFTIRVLRYIHKTVIRRRRWQRGGGLVSPGEGIAGTEEGLPFEQFSTFVRQASNGREEGEGVARIPAI